MMLEPLDRCRRDSTLFQFTTKRLRDFIDPNHLLIQIDEQLDIAKLVVPLEERYWRLRQELCKRDQAAILSTGASMATPSLYLTPR